MPDYVVRRLIDALNRRTPAGVGHPDPAARSGVQEEHRRRPRVAGGSRRPAPGPHGSRRPRRRPARGRDRARRRGPTPGHAVRRGARRRPTRWSCSPTTTSSTTSSIRHERALRPRHAPPHGRRERRGDLMVARDRLRGRRAPELHEDQAGHGRAGGARRRGRARAHRPALRRVDERRLLPRSRAATRPTTTSARARAPTRSRPRRVMTAFEPLVAELRPDAVVVVGDVNSTLACALVAAKAGAVVAHVEAGLRSRDWTMPEEVNRVVADRVSDLLFAPSADAVDNLRAEGYHADQIHLAGNVMIDTLYANLDQALERRRAASPRLDAGRLRARHPAPTGQRGRSGDARPTARGARSRSPPTCPSSCRSIRARRPRDPAASADRTASHWSRPRATSTSSPCRPRPDRAHRLGRRPGGDDRARCARA